MAKFPTFPTLYDNVLQISIKKLKEFGYLEKNKVITSSLHWSRNGEETASISIRVNTFTEPHHIELIYNTNGEPRNYKVSLVTIPSNLGKGKIWYFLCPHTHKKCRKLYLIGGYFLHREAFTGCMYESQTVSKHYRFLENTFGAVFKTERLYEQLYSKHFTKYYKGKPTKKYLRILEQLKKAENIDERELFKMKYL